MFDLEREFESYILHASIPGRPSAHTIRDQLLKKERDLKKSLLETEKEFKCFDFSELLMNLFPHIIFPWDDENEYNYDLDETHPFNPSTGSEEESEVESAYRSEIGYMPDLGEFYYFDNFDPPDEFVRGNVSGYISDDSDDSDDANDNALLDENE